jgi:hypothetical protein
MSKQINYSDRAGGVTSRSIKKFHNVHRLGRLYYVKGTSQDHQYHVIVVGENGRCCFGGLCWGYQGEGPHGLVQLLKTLGLSQDVADDIAFYSPCTEKSGTDWVYNFQ